MMNGGKLPEPRAPQTPEERALVDAIDAIKPGLCSDLNAEFRTMVLEVQVDDVIVVAERERGAVQTPTETWTVRHLGTGRIAHGVSYLDATNIATDIAINIATEQRLRALLTGILTERP